MKGFVFALALGLFCTGSSVTLSSDVSRADIVVYSATPAGIMAAVAAAREGKQVILLEPGRHVGGMVSGGLGATDAGNRACVGGLAREFFERVRRHYFETYGVKSSQLALCSDGFHFEPHVAEDIFNAMLKEAKVHVIFGQSLESVTKTGNRIDSVATAKGESFSARVFIDASYEGDLLAKAKVPYAVGRDARDHYGEALAGVQAHSPAHQWAFPIPAYSADRKALPFVRPESLGKPGTGDAKVQAYNYRLCLTQRRDNQVPFPKPKGYDADQFELLARLLQKNPKLRVRQLMDPSPMPNDKTDVNNNGPFSTDHIGANWDYPDGDPATRERIIQDHRRYVQGFLYYLANDKRVPEPLRKEMASWGLAKDEFQDTDHWPHQLYVREARRMVGDYVMTQADFEKNRHKKDSIGLGSYNADSHHVQRVIDAEGHVLNEGDIQVPVKPYSIAYRSMTPKEADCANLLAPVCVSASHVAYGTIRMEPVFMILGHACGNAAALSIDNKTPVQKIAVKNLQDRLLAQKAILDPEKLSGNTPQK